MLMRQAKKCQKDEKKELTKLKKAISSGSTEEARIYASNAIRKKNERINITKMASRVDAVASRVQTAVTMQQVAKSIGSTVKMMDRAAQTMNLEQMSLIMDAFEKQFEDLDVQTGYMEGAIGGTTALDVPQDDVDLLIQRVADEDGLELNAELTSIEAPQYLPDEAELNERLARLREAS
ncbi:hypothetical protein LPJ64_004035 [Coemansia asiatica]|uniref:Uncharacterized protein n=1 Tax=Coemansia asiatica TaxID=1052880 RepID=A0A9W7XJ62_9FUNG|nr:hypothetical protein LPJ64_004035 [Coemansia asiatica]KAJ2887508.1 hypothetical protein FB639_001265 [Coemansia asiatica]